MLEYNHLWWRAISFKNVLGVDAWWRMGVVILTFLILFVRSNLVRYDRGRSSTSIQIVYDTHSLRFLWKLRGRPTDNPFIYIFSPVSNLLSHETKYHDWLTYPHICMPLAGFEVFTQTMSDSHRIWWGCINEDVPFVKNVAKQR